MRVSTDHRVITRWAPKSCYRAAADDFLAAAISLGFLDSIAICGSLAKDDVIPGWSDLNIVCIARGDAPRGETLGELNRIVKDLTERTAIGIGFDLVWRTEFDRSSKIGGRPLAMTYEVAQCGEFHINPAPFAAAAPMHTVLEQLRQERAVLLLAEMHNWRRACFADDEPETNKLAVKTLLKMLKQCVSPYPGSCFTHAADLTRLPRDIPDIAREAFMMAVETRATWGQNRDIDHARSAILSLLLTEIDALDLIGSFYSPQSSEN
ncbi:hypothetical protein [Mycobacterium marinum]|uniref:hypothetical protein n=1 Tax=Mycobacterium marinum TaxID=1781 RepID=UPI000B978624|nr:hypothetical protein [Mycobacterium marinum]MDC8985086.1 hypothetical protein [Mycobacterium marinum]MDC8997160.1 hypothetical protein [Mycobacterium marinum]MDC9002372.1 hypothetical protein [Mycobacterium marinum]MDC9013131.1 hypothetical protein [Mycobacterium marinum]MDC9018563.1 hypothetical protein [Mycobacterium marinum]